MAKLLKLVRCPQLFSTLFVFRLTKRFKSVIFRELGKREAAKHLIFDHCFKIEMLNDGQMQTSWLFF